MSGLALEDAAQIVPMHARRVARLRGAYKRLLPAFLRRRRIRRLLGTLIPNGALYLENETPVTMQGAGERWRPGQRRIVLVTHDLSASGAPRTTTDLARVFRQAGWFVTMLSPVDGPYRASIEREGFRLVIDPTVLTEGSWLLEQFALASDLAICNTVVSFGAVNTLARRVPVFWYLHEVSLLADMLAGDPRVSRALGAAHLVLAGSEIPAGIVRGRRPDVRVLPYGMRPLSLPESVSAPGRSPVVSIVAVGAIESRKGQDLAVAAVAALNERERSALRLTFHGRVLEPSFAKAVDETMRSVAETNWGGELDPEACAGAIVAADAILVSSREDTLPLVSLDALGAGRVLMCTATTGTSAWIEDGVSGFIAESADANAIAAMLSRALARRANWPEIGRAGRAVFDAAFSEKAFAQTLLSEADRAMGVPSAAAGREEADGTDQRTDRTATP